MADTKNPQGGGSNKAKKKTGAKKAKKAIARAEKSVAEARQAVRALDKRLRKRVSTLSKQTARLSAEQERELKKWDAAGRDEGTPPGADAARTSSDEPALGLTPPLQDDGARTGDEPPRAR
jgi:hypothetical protein